MDVTVIVSELKSTTNQDQCCCLFVVGTEKGNQIAKAVEVEEGKNLAGCSTPDHRVVQNCL